jgi:DNA-binding MarR family transcriptional regulator
MAKDEIDRIVAQWKRTRPDLDLAPTHVLQRITRLGLLQQLSFADVLATYGLSWGESVLLAALRREGPPYRMNPSRLYGSMILSSGGMTKLCDRLERAGLLERRADPADRRGRLIGLTAKGLAVADRAIVDHLANEERLLSALSAAERKKLRELLRKLLASEPFQALDPAGRDRRTEPAKALD